MDRLGWPSCFTQLQHHLNRLGWLVIEGLPFGWSCLLLCCRAPACAAGWDRGPGAARAWGLSRYCLDGPTASAHHSSRSGAPEAGCRPSRSGRLNQAPSPGPGAGFCERAAPATRAILSSTEANLAAGWPARLSERGRACSPWSCCPERFRCAAKDQDG